MGKVNENARMRAFKILHKIETEGAFSNIALKDGLAGSGLSAADKRLVTTIVYGCVRYKRYLDYVISLFSNVKLKKLSCNVVLILRMGIYQIIKLERIPDSAAVNESVKLSGKLAYQSKGFINAILRKVCAQKENITLPKEKISCLGVKYSYPDELAKMWVEEYGEEFAEELMKAGNENAKLTVRVNTLKTDAESLIEILKKEGVGAEQTQIENILVIDGSDVASLDSYKQGLFTPQGIGSYFACMALGVKSGDMVMDMCAAPGGKSTHICELMKNKGKIYSFDIHSHRADLIKRSAERIGAGIINALCADSTVCMEEYIDKADAVLTDVPCSGLGIIRKKPDIKWGFNIEDMPSITKVQHEILSSSSRYVKKGGTLVYSTCTVSKAENTEIIKRFLKEHDEFYLCDFNDALPHAYKKDSAKDGMAEFYPHIDGIDGFFICKMKRKV